MFFPTCPEGHFAIPSTPSYPVQSSLGCKTSLVDATGFRRSIFKGSPRGIQCRAPL